MRPLLLKLVLSLTLTACAAVETRSSLDRPLGESYASIGDVVLRVTLEEDLPNAFGRADVFGRTRERGFTEIRYMGLNSSGYPVFRRRDVNIYSNETTMSRAGFNVGTATAQRYENTVTATAVTTSSPQAQIGILPSDTVEIALNPAFGKRITVGAHGIEILDYNAAGVRYRVF